MRCGDAAGRSRIRWCSASLDDGAPDGFAAAVDVLNGTDVAIVQHEYGIYGGADGDDVLDVLDGARRCRRSSSPTPCVRAPDAHQRDVLERVCDAADAVVVMTESARDRLIEGFDVDAAEGRR